MWKKNKKKWLIFVIAEALDKSDFIFSRLVAIHLDFLFYFLFFVLDFSFDAPLKLDLGGGGGDISLTSLFSCFACYVCFFS